jgi:hypothetical protein
LEPNHTCLNCGVAFYMRASRKRRQFCVRACRTAYQRKLAADSAASSARFWSFVSKSDGCWLWAGHLNEKGYGSFEGFGAPKTKAHRASWFIHHGAWPDGDLLHSCDVANCVNPEHLRVGDHAENMRDMVARDRSTRGIRHRHRKLSDSDVVEMRRMREAGATYYVIADRFAVAYQTVFAVCARKTWKHVA